MILLPYAFIETSTLKQIHYITDISITKSNRKLYEEAVITCFNTPDTNNETQNKYLNIGDDITIYLGYDEKKEEDISFKGFITRVFVEKTSIKIYCVNSGYFLKTLFTKKPFDSKKPITPKEVISTLVANSLGLNELKNDIIPLDIFSANEEMKANEKGKKIVNIIINPIDAVKDKVGVWSWFDRTSLLEILKKLRNNVGLVSFVRTELNDGKWEEVLYVGNKEKNADKPKILLDDKINIPSDGFKLNKKTLEATSRVIKGIYFFTDKKTKTVKQEIIYVFYTHKKQVKASLHPPIYGDVSDTYKVHNETGLYGTKQDFKNNMQLWLKNISELGLGGNIIIYGYPKINPSNVVQMKSTNDADIDGKSYIVNTIETNFSITNGLRQTLTLGTEMTFFENTATTITEGEELFDES